MRIHTLVGILQWCLQSRESFIFNNNFGRVLQMPQYKSVQFTARGEPVPTLLFFFLTVAVMNKVAGY